MSLSIDERKAKRAFGALLKHSQLEKQHTEYVWLTITTFHPIELLKENVTRISLKHSLQTPGTQRCLITKDPEIDYKAMFVDKKIKGVHHLMSIRKLKSKCKTSKSMNELLNDYDVFLADQRVINLLPKALKVELSKKKNEAMPINLTKKDLQKEVLHAITSTRMNFFRGSHHAIKIATTDFNAYQAMDNLREAIPTIVAGTKGGADNIRSLHIKTAVSTSLVVYEADQDGAGDDYGHEEEDAESDQEEEDE